MVLRTEPARCASNATVRLREGVPPPVSGTDALKGRVQDTGGRRRPGDRCGDDRPGPVAAALSQRSSKRLASDALPVASLRFIEEGYDSRLPAGLGQRPWGMSLRLALWFGATGE